MTNDIAQVETVYAGEVPDVVIFHVKEFTTEQLENYAKHVRNTFGEGCKVAILDTEAMETVGVIQNGGLPEDGRFTKFDKDPEAVAWARGHVQGFVDKMHRFEKQAREENRMEQAQQWRKVGNFASMAFIGGKGCSIAAFDERLPQFVELFEKTEG